ncbi:hypothetical protein [Paenibacillus sp. UNC496MF]|uniref:hypothetical protein n=1 Tax=Paenibacillus sp. UNC496MF TaxID=1502753 RepID=UPI000B8425B8|nr:hypothetical protein [Paenibacillus sp. UNC496MF]
MKQIRQLQLCFDEDGREIEVLDVSMIDPDTLTIEENPIFSERVSFGDRIRVRRIGDVYYYIETLRKSELVRRSWLLSRRVSRSAELSAAKARIAEAGGNWEQVFGGLLVINVPQAFEGGIAADIDAIIADIDRLGGQA